MDGKEVSLLTTIAPLALIILITIVGSKALERFMQKREQNRVLVHRFCLKLFYIGLPFIVISMLVSLVRIFRIWL